MWPNGWGWKLKLQERERVLELKIPDNVHQVPNSSTSPLQPWST